MTYKIGEIIYREKNIVLNEGLKTAEVIVANDGDRVVQVGSHYHFFEVNKYLRFDREKAFGKHLDIPAGTAVRFEPGVEKKVLLVEYAGRGIANGFNGLTNGNTKDSFVNENALKRAKEKEFM